MGGLTMQQAKLHPFGHGGDVKTAEAYGFDPRNN